MPRSSENLFENADEKEPCKFEILKLNNDYYNNLKEIEVDECLKGVQALAGKHFATIYRDNLKIWNDELEVITVINPSDKITSDSRIKFIKDSFLMVT